ncbi:MAG: RdgB/HAM1 family non-canonical purine NTP pyrophosphatase [Planctomycetaceae bacterium]|jgi:XTP/dITP diphosphohydrolase|nr:RdgB/HAM1 family non-canonical purine NTP pyrophosphatase [Planctomycetaceae bacterium]
MKTLVFGTNNRKKGIELAELLAPYSIEVKTLADFSETLDVVEDGKTFIENARKKAAEQARFLNAWVVGEDSGLCVDALKGAPGIYSARFAALPKEADVIAVPLDNTSDEANNQRLLELLKDVPWEQRTAHYTCAAALSDPSGTMCGESENVCRGIIRFEPSGDGGFGYDPLFEITEYHQTFGELSSAVKRTISHRARTIRELTQLILTIDG